MGPRLQDFVTAARQSVATGVDVRLDDSGRPRVASRRSVWGRLVNWIRNRAFPNRRQAENMRVLRKLEATVRREFPDVSAQRRRSAIRRAADSSLSQGILAAARDIRASANYRPGNSLDEEIDASLRLGYASEVIRARGDTALPDDEFRNLVAKFNETMCDLHHRFPRLRYLPPPVLSQRLASSPGGAAEYRPATKTIQFRKADLRAWDRRIAREISKGWIAPKAPGIAGVICHEYGHHLGNVDSPRPWYSELTAALKRNGVSFGSERGLPGDAAFSKAVKGHLARMGVGRYAGVNPREFQAEVLGWYMSPNYGQPGEPKMPAFLEDWVRGSFRGWRQAIPMQIPSPAYCLNCRHFGEWIHGDQVTALRDGGGVADEAFGHSCTAFPRGIPPDVWTGEVRHDRPIPGDNGVQFEAVDPNGDTPATNRADDS